VWTALLLTLMASESNVLGTSLQTCSTAPLTGYFRNGSCTTGPTDTGSHVVCAQMTERFLRFTKARGNDLTTPSPRHRFPGLKPGDRWCLCALRWREAEREKLAPPVVEAATHEAALRFVSKKSLADHAIPAAD
jgi:hypothetical protein